jgi:hypothetical protein
MAKEAVKPILGNPEGPQSPLLAALGTPSGSKSGQAPAGLQRSRSRPNAKEYPDVFLRSGGLDSSSHFSIGGLFFGAER